MFPSAESGLKYAVLWVVQVESSQETNTRAVQDLTAKLQREYEEKLQREQQKHREEIENLQVCILCCLCSPKSVFRDNRGKKPFITRTGIQSDVYSRRFKCFDFLSHFADDQAESIT